MPLLHFAFGNLAREQLFTEQIDAFCEKILASMSLRASICPEFLPILNNSRAQWAIPNSAQITPDGGVAFKEGTNSPPVALLPADVWMLCFANLPITKLRQWPHAEHYGKLAIVFSNRFRSQVNAKPVSYYQLHELQNDPKVIVYNEAIKQKQQVEELAQELLAYRKPAKLWPKFRQLFGSISIQNNPTGLAIEHITYSRYQDGYEFFTEAESRVVTDEYNQYIPFNESDVLEIIAPSIDGKNHIQNWLIKNWTTQPPVTVYPT